MAADENARAGKRATTPVNQTQMCSWFDAVVSTDFLERVEKRFRLIRTILAECDKMEEIRYAWNSLFCVTLAV
jgi:hypothetical protein